MTESVKFGMLNVGDHFERWCGGKCVVFVKTRSIGESILANAEAEGLMLNFKNDTEVC